jgi:hypothetical protein
MKLTEIKSLCKGDEDTENRKAEIRRILEVCPDYESAIGLIEAYWSMSLIQRSINTTQEDQKRSHEKLQKELA